MRSTVIAAALAACVRFTAAQDCDDDIEIKDTTATIDCQTIKGDLVVHPDAAGELNLDGIEEIGGKLQVSNSSILSLTSSTLAKVEGGIEVTNCESLTLIDFPALAELSEFAVEKAPAAREISIGANVKSLKVKTVSIVDSYLRTLLVAGLREVEVFKVVDCERLVEVSFEELKEAGSITFASNGQKLGIDVPVLEKAKALEFRNIANFSADALEEAGSVKFDKCGMESIEMRNLTKVGTFSIINNQNLATGDLGALSEIEGDLTAVNNTKLTTIDFLDKLENAGAMKLAGSFDSIDFPSLELVSGSFEMTTTSKNESVCDDAPEDVVKGKFECTYDNEKANEGDTDSGTTSSGSDEDDEEDAAGLLSVNSALLGLVLLIGIAQML